MKKITVISTLCILLIFLFACSKPQDRLNIAEQSCSDDAIVLMQENPNIDDIGDMVIIYDKGDLKIFTITDSGTILKVKKINIDKIINEKG